MNKTPLIASLLLTACGGTTYEKFFPVFADDDTSKAAYVRVELEEDCSGTSCLGPNRDVAIAREVYLADVVGDQVIEGELLAELSPAYSAGAFYVRSKGYVVVQGGDGPAVRIDLDGNVEPLTEYSGASGGYWAPSQDGDLLVQVVSTSTAGDGLHEIQDFYFYDADTLIATVASERTLRYGPFVWTEDGQVLVEEWGEEPAFYTIDPMTGAVTPAAVDRCYKNRSRSGNRLADGRSLPSSTALPINVQSIAPERCELTYAP